MKTLYTLILITLILPFSSSAQTNADPKFSVFLEVFGSGGLYSLNGDYLIKPNLSVRAGVTAWTYADLISTSSLTAMPLGIHYLVGKKHKGEFGVSMLNGFSTGNFFGLDPMGNKSEWVSLLFCNLGYRYQPQDGGFFFRVTAYPGRLNIVPSDEIFTAKIPVGLSLGYTLK